MNKRIALVTGASAGLGEASARNLASQGYQLILVARRGDRLETLASELHEEYGVDCLCLVMDVRDRKAVSDTFQKLPEAWRDISVLINNAGLASGMSTLEEGDIDDWDKMIDTNIKGLLYVSRAVIPLMRKDGSGHILNLGSIAAIEIYPNGNVYCSTKAAVDMLNKGMRIELLKYPIRVTAIHPGAVETEFSIVRFHGDEERAKKVYQGFDNLIADDVAEAIWFVLSRPPHVNINELTIMPTAQAAAGVIARK